MNIRNKVAKIHPLTLRRSKAQAATASLALAAQLVEQELDPHLVALTGLELQTMAFGSSVLFSLSGTVSAQESESLAAASSVSESSYKPDDSASDSASFQGSRFPTNLESRFTYF